MLEQIFDIVNLSIDIAFKEEKYQLNFYEYLQANKIKKDDILNFINSSLCLSLLYQIEELEFYLIGGEKSKLVEESYGWMGKSRAKKLKEYLENIIEDAKRYERSKRRGRKPGSKNKKKPTAVTDK